MLHEHWSIKIQSNLKNSEKTLFKKFFVNKVIQNKKKDF